MSQLPSLSVSELKPMVHQALRLWHSPNNGTSPLEPLYLYQQTLEQATNARQATNELLLEALKTLETNDPQEAGLLRLRFLEQTPMYLAANQINLAESTANKKQRKAINRLTKILLNHEQQVRGKHLAALEQRLDLPAATELVGIESLLQQLLTLLTTPDAGWIISLEGLGGIGKTALANAVVRQVALTPHFHNLAWVSAKQQDFLPGMDLPSSPQPAIDANTLVDSLLTQLDDSTSTAAPPDQKLALLSRLLKQQPYLIIIDNLETVEDYQALLPTLQKLANPTKFLLTSRHSLRAYAGVSCLPLTELSQADSLALLKHEAETRQLAALANATPAQLKSIYRVVGGNPLALKLVVGQLYALPLAQVLENLKQAQGKRADQLYTYIYWQAWHTLTPTSRQTLLVMPLVQNGPMAQLAAASQLEIDDLTEAVQQLTDLSLLEISGGIEQRRYRIHRLTETFLLNEVAKWQSAT